MIRAESWKKIWIAEPMAKRQSMSIYIAMTSSMFKNVVGILLHPQTWWSP